MGKLALDASTISEDVAYVVSTEKARDHRQDEGGQEIAPVEPYAPEVMWSRWFRSLRPLWAMPRLSRWPPKQSSITDLLLDLPSKLAATRTSFNGDHRHERRRGQTVHRVSPSLERQ